MNFWPFVNSSTGLYWADYQDFAERESAAPQLIKLKDFTWSPKSLNYFVL